MRFRLLGQLSLLHARRSQLRLSCRQLGMMSAVALLAGQGAKQSPKEKKPRARLSKAFQRIWQVARPERFRLGAGVSLLFVSSGITLSLPHWFGLLLDRSTSEAADATIGRLSPTSALSPFSLLQEFSCRLKTDSTKTVMLLLGGLFGLGALCNGGRVFLFRTAGVRMAKRMRSALFRSIVREKSYPEFMQLGVQSGDLVSRMNADVGVMCDSASQSISDTLRAGVQSIAGLSMMTWTSPALTGATLTSLPFLAFMAWAAGHGVRDTSGRAAAELGSLTGHTAERFANLREVHAAGQNDYEQREFERLLGRLVNAGFDEARVRSLFFGAAGFIGNFMVLGVVFGGAKLVETGSLTIGQLGAFIVYAAYVGISSQRLAAAYAQAMRAVAASDRIWAVMNVAEYENAVKHAPPPVPKVLAQPTWPEAGQVALQLRQVNFAYPDAPNTPVLQDISFEVRAGEWVAVAGVSGAGKSTIASLILRLYEQQSGDLFWCGQDIRRIDLDSWRQEFVAATLQDTKLFTGTILDNVTYACRDHAVMADANLDMKIAQVVEAAQVSAFLSDLSESRGLQSPVGECGAALSGGQRQRVLLARALLKEAPLLVMDEATSALDVQTEGRVQQSLRRLFDATWSHRPTVLAITHRMSSLKAADRIVVLGARDPASTACTVLAEGTFEQLSQNPQARHLFEQLELDD